MLLPPELVAHIFSFLQGERSALEECSKAHPMFLRLAEPYLYAEIQVMDKRALSELYKQLSENSRVLYFPRVLEFRRTSIVDIPPEPEVLLIMSIIPRMANLVSLTLDQQWSHSEDFFSTFRTCLQHSSIEELSLKGFYNFPLSILDNGKNIKKLTLSECTAMSISTSGSPHQSLETLIIGLQRDRVIIFWATHRAAILTTLELRGSLEPYWTEIAELLTACSNSLTRLHLDVARQLWQIVYCSEGRWSNDHLAFPITLSAHTSLVELSISALLCSFPNSMHCALPAILRLIKTAPFVTDVVLGFRQFNYNPLAVPLSPLLDRLRSDFPASGIHPRIDLHINDIRGHRNIPDAIAMAENEA